MKSVERKSASGVQGQSPWWVVQGSIASQKLIAVIKDIWQPNHAKFVYLAQRRSQEFSCEPNFGGGGRAPSPPGCATGDTICCSCDWLSCIWILIVRECSGSPQGKRQFGWSNAPSKLPFSQRGSGPRVNMAPWTNSSEHPKRHLDLFSRFNTTHGCVQQPRRHTDHAISVAIGRTFALCACNVARKVTQ